MPKPRKPAPDPIARLARLPRQPDKTILGGRHTLQTEIDNDGQKVHPQVVVWVDETSEAVLGADVIPLEQSTDGGITEAVTMLINTLNGTPTAFAPGGLFPPQQRGLPGTIVVNDTELVAAITARFAPLGVNVAYAESLPQVDQIMAGLFQSLGFDENGLPPPPFAWEIAPDVATPLYAAAAKFWRRRPWQYMLDHPTLTVTLGAHGPAEGVAALHAAILGANETVFGVACYFSPDDYQAALEQGERLGDVEETALDNAIELMRLQGLPVDVIPRDILRGMLAEVTDIEIASDTNENPMAANALACYFEDKDEVDTTYLAWMTAHAVKAPSRDGVPVFVRTSREEEPRQPNERETYALALTLDALSQFFSRFHAQLEAGAADGVPLTLQVRVGTDKTPVSVSYTPQPEEDMLALDLADDDDEDGLTPGPRFSCDRRRGDHSSPRHQRWRGARRRGRHPAPLAIRLTFWHQTWQLGQLQL